MTAEAETAEGEIRALLDRLATAIRDKDVGAALAPFDDAVLTFDLAPPLWVQGKGEEARQAISAWFATWSGPIGYDRRGFAVAIDSDIAFAHGYVRIHGTKRDGEKPDVWARQTVCLRRRDGVWRIVHDHTSVPFYMDGSYRAAVDLQP